ncbi:L-lactate dehydrogenase [Helicocarpus griseus UAMH5409]|uniref:L-lactate dehydrogenase n=1 Tax=Helicocarpus griseus UAMH5409 TaxID=1447875 RepID=A0A2B7X1R8_9EURO|nr:L-lactate dehydrogenase [Helicocarpus griseus UAMH5409]
MSAAKDGPRKPANRQDLRPVRISIIGAGNVGATTAYAVLLSGLAAEIVLVDVNNEKAEGEAMDLSHAAPNTHQTRIISGDYDACAGSSVVLITAGANQKPGQTRMDLLQINAGIFKDIIPKVAKAAPEAILVVAGNPVDVLTYVSWKLSGFEKHRVIGSGTMLDTARFRYELGQHYQVDPRNIHADIIGEHGDTELPVWSQASIVGMRLQDYCRQSGQKYNHEAMVKCFQETKNAAYEIIKRKKMTDKGIAAALMRLVETILRDENTLLTVSTVGTHGGVSGVSLSVPVKVNRTGAHYVLDPELSGEEKAELEKSAKNIKANIDSVDLGK